jgi:hypothetical protein
VDHNTLKNTIHLIQSWYRCIDVFLQMEGYSL